MTRPPGNFWIDAAGLTPQQAAQAHYPALIPGLNTREAAIMDYAEELAAPKADASDLTAHVNDVSAAHAGSAISFTPTGTIASTDVQAAVAEVASERVTADAALDARVASLESGQSGGLPAGAGYSIISDTDPGTKSFPYVWFKPSGGTIVLQGGFVPDGPTAPTFSAGPAITGTALVGSVLTCDGGTAVGSTPITKTYQWQRAGATIVGATSSTYTLQSSDVGHAITCVVALANGTSPNGSGTSNAITPAVPVNTVAPAITGSAITGQTLTVGNGTWTSAGSPIYTRQWQHDLGSGFVNIAGATGTTYGPLASGDETHPLKCVVTATDANGPASHDSNTVTPSASATAPGQPTGLTLTPGNTTIDASWTAPASNGGSAITTYLVEYRTPNGSGSYTTFTHSASTTPSITITGLTNASPYGVRVSAVNAIGTGTPTAEATTTPAGASYFDPAPYGTMLVYSNTLAITGKNDGDQITQVNDLSGHGRHRAQATSGKQPLYKTNIFGSDPGIRFNGAGDYLAYLAGSVWYTGTTLTYIARLIRRGHTDNAGVTALTNGGGSAYDYSAPDGAIIGAEPDSTHIGVTRSGQDIGNVAAPAIGTAFVYTVKFDGTNGTVYINGSAVASPTVSSGTFSLEWMVLGARILAGIVDAPYGQFDFGADVLFAEALNDSDRNAVEAGL